MIFRKSKDGHQSAQEAYAALIDAKKSLHKTKSRSREVTEVSTALRLLRERNHFIEKLGFIMEGSGR